MIEQRINDSLKELEKTLSDIDSARKQVEKTVNSYGELRKSSSEYVSDLKNLNRNVRALADSIASDYEQRILELNRERRIIVDNASSATQKLAEATEFFKNSLGSVESKLKYSMIVNVVLFVVTILTVLLKAS